MLKFILVAIVSVSLAIAGWSGQDKSSGHVSGTALAAGLECDRQTKGPVASAIPLTNSTVGGNASEKTPSSTQEDAQESTPVRLRFEHGVRSIFEDSKGNFWFGTWQEGVARFDGKKLTYFTVEDGLDRNQVRNVFEDR